MHGNIYAGGIAFADSQLGRLIDALRAKGVFDSTAIIIAGDHGESFGEHGEIEHGIFLYEGTLHVPSRSCARLVCRRGAWPGSRASST